jgi:hypothetical protein
MDRLDRTMGVRRWGASWRFEMQGSIRVSFAGTYHEAVEFCRDKPGVTAPKGLAHAGDDDGLPMLCAVYKSAVQYDAAKALITSLGWDPEFHCVVPNGRGFRG